MVMKQKKQRNMMGKNLRMTIRNSLGRYIAIIAIIALGAGLFCGLRVTKVDMIATVQKYTDQQNMFDLQVAGNYGWTDRQVEKLSQVEGLSHVEGSVSMDVLLSINSTDTDPYRLISIPQQVNRIHLDAGRMPEKPSECLGDSYFMDESFIGKEIIISPQNDSDTLEALAYDRYTIVGLVNTPLFLNMQRGSTSIGSGVLKTFFYLPAEAFARDVYTGIYLTLDRDYPVYSNRYNDAMEDMSSVLEAFCDSLAQERFEEVMEEFTDQIADGEQKIKEGEQELADGEAKLAEGRLDYNNGVAEFNTAKADTEKELNDAEQALLDAEQELERNRDDLDYGWSQLTKAQKELENNQKTVSEGKEALQEKRRLAEHEFSAARAELDASAAEVTSGLTQINDGLSQVNDAIAQLEETIIPLKESIAQLDEQITQLDAAISGLDTRIEEVEAALQQATAEGDEEAVSELRLQLEELQSQRDGYAGQRDDLAGQRSELDAQLTQLLPTYNDLLSQQQELLNAKAPLDEAMAAIQAGYRELDAAEVDAYAQLDAAEVELNQAQAQLDAAGIQIREQLDQLNDGYIQLHAAEEQLMQAWEEFRQGEAEAMTKLSEAKQELKDAETELLDAEQDLISGRLELDEARAELEDARKELEKADEPTVYILDRNTNLGYVVFENDSDIVNGIAKIFPAFFLAVAALVCVTTMTRMVDEERTQIGILKALGYGSGSIMGKYLAYTGSASLIGCSVGMLLGTVLFPQIIWNAYCIMYNFSDQLVLSYDLATILFILISYTGLTVLVTVYCCRRELKVVPAELIRPRAPTSGKKLLIENFGFWRKLSFLNKVAIRNIFRYRQRLAMMLLGIGGCTALLVTGFGLNDSISGIAGSQFDQIVVYDIAVSFRDPLTVEDRTAFCSEISSVSEEVLFCHQSTLDIQFGDSVKNVNFVVSDSPLQGYVNMRNRKTAVSMPGTGEVVISIGAAENMGIKTGDRIVLRNADLEEMELTVSGIFDNNVYNFAIITGDTMRSLWGRDPEIQTAFVNHLADIDVHLAGARIADTDGVLNVSINRDTADTVGGMLDALDAVIVVVVICAGLLACIVLYNLTNINIKERLREIATIKVLGFRAGETASYVFKENLVLTFVGTVLGLFAGKLLHTAVMSYVRIDMIWFDNVIAPVSYLIAAILTLLAALIVDFIMFFQLDRINMAEALKSVE